MDQFRFWVVFVAALIPVFLGGIWYSKLMFGNAWMKAAHLRDEDGKGPHLAVLLIVSYIFSVMISMFMMSVVIHQMGVYSTLANEVGINDPGTPNGAYLADFMSKYGRNFRTFKHGAFHGVLAGIMFALPILGTMAIFEKKGFKYIAVHTLYWIVSLSLVGGVICAYM
jgi:hypothetical protein